MRGEAMRRVQCNCIEERTDLAQRSSTLVEVTFRCYVYPLVTTSPRPALETDRRLAFEL